MRAFARVDPDLDDDPTVCELPDDAARYAWVLTILRGKKVGGRWESRAHWSRAVGADRLGYLDALIEVGLVEEMASGTVRVPPAKWRDWQADPTGVERQRRHRARKKGEPDGA